MSGERGGRRVADALEAARTAADGSARMGGGQTVTTSAYHSSVRGVDKCRPF